MPRVLFGITTGVGAASYFRGLFQSLKGAEFEVVFVAQDEAGAGDFARSEGAQFEPIVAARRPHPLTDLGTLHQLGKILLRVKPDVAVWGTPKVGLLGCIASRLTGTTSVYVVHGLRYQGSTGLARRALMAFEYLTMRMANHVVSVGYEIGECLVEDGLLKNVPRVVNHGSANGIEPPRPVASGVARAELGLPQDSFLVGFVGRVTRDKGLMPLLRAWSRIENSKDELVLVVAGRREPDSFDPEFAELINSAKNVAWLGHVDDLVQVYSAIDCLVLPSFREGLPAVVLEAGAYGLPAVVSSCPGVSEAIVPGKTGLVVDVTRPEEISDRLLWLASNRMDAVLMGDNARDHVLRHYSRSDVHRWWSSFLFEVVAR